jgi:hypothetical protein
MSEEKVKKPLWKRWWVWVIAIIIIGAAASGGGEEKQTAPANTSQEASKQEPKKEEPSQPVQDFKKYLDDGFKTTTWYSNIKDIEMANVNGQYAVTVKTDLSKNEIDKKKAENIISTVLGWANANGSKYKVLDVAIHDNTGIILAHKENPIK